MPRRKYFRGNAFETVTIMTFVARSCIKKYTYYYLKRVIVYNVHRIYTCIISMSKKKIIKIKIT